MGSDLTNAESALQIFDRMYKALCIIDSITCEQQRLETHPKYDKETNDAIRLIYRVAHVAIGGSCLHVHSEWVAELEKVYEDICRQSK